MHIPSLLFAASACMRVAYGDFLVLTESPYPASMVPPFTNAQDASSWTTSVVLNGFASFGRYTKSLGPPYQSTVTSIQSLVKEFVATASNYSIPVAVTDPDTTETIFGKPDWYDALPSDVRSFKEQEWNTIKSIASEVIAARQTTTRSTGGAPALPTGSTGLKNAGWAVAGAAAAMFL